MDEALTREANNFFQRGLILIALFLAGLSVIVFLGVRAIKDRKS